VSNPTSTDINAHSVFPSEVLVDYVRVYNTTAPLRIAIQQTGTNLVLTWPSNIVAHLQAQTNPPPSGIGSNWYAVSTQTNRVPVTPSNGSAFFRLTTP
jgi:hypothetical protein